MPKVGSRWALSLYMSTCNNIFIIYIYIYNRQRTTLPMVGSSVWFCDWLLRNSTARAGLSAAKISGRCTICAAVYYVCHGSI